VNPQIAGVVRIVITSVLAGAVAKGVISEDQAGAVAELIIGTLGIVAMAAWSWISNSVTAMIGHIAKSDKVVEVKVTSQAAADAQPSDKVTGPKE